jgi:type II secretory pathway pseudopilin PulG
MKSLKHKISKTITRKTLSGFTLIEVLVAGIILLSIMTAVGKISSKALAASKNQSSRSEIESAISDNIQMIQKLDSNLLLPNNQTSRLSFCTQPAEELKRSILSMPIPPGTVRGYEELTPDGNSRTIDIDYQNNPPNQPPAESPFALANKNQSYTILRIIYKFTQPESISSSNPNGINEFRVIELNPHFHRYCI